MPERYGFIWSGGETAAGARLGSPAYGFPEQRDRLLRSSAAASRRPFDAASESSADVSSGPQLVGTVAPAPRGRLDRSWGERAGTGRRRTRVPIHVGGTAVGAVEIVDRSAGVCAMWPAHRKPRFADQFPGALQSVPKRNLGLLHGIHAVVRLILHHGTRPATRPTQLSNVVSGSCHSVNRPGLPAALSEIAAECGERPGARRFGFASWQGKKTGSTAAVFGSRFRGNGEAGRDGGGRPHAATSSRHAGRWLDMAPCL